MTMSFTLLLMLTRKYVSWFFLMALSISSLGLLSTIATISQLRSGIDDSSFWLILRDVALYLPSVLRDFMPFVVLFGTLFTVVQMRSRGELLAIRTVGMSVWEFSLPALILIALISVTLIVLSPWISAGEKNFARIQSDSYAAREIYSRIYKRLQDAGLPESLTNDTSVMSQALQNTIDIGTWFTVQAHSGDGVVRRYMIRVGRPIETPDVLSDVDWLEMDGDGRVARRFFVKRMNLFDNRWEGKGVSVMNTSGGLAVLGETRSNEDEEISYVWWGIPEVRNALLTTHAGLIAPVWRLPELSRQMRILGFDDGPATVALHIALVRPLWLTVMVLMAIASSFFLTTLSGRYRSSIRVTVVCLASIVLNTLVNLVNASVTAGVFPLELIWLVPLAALGIMVAALLRIEDFNQHNRLVRFVNRV